MNKARLIVAAICLLMVFSSTANKKEKLPTVEKLDAMSGRQCVEMLETCGYRLPKVYKDQQAQYEAVKTIIHDIKNGNLSDGVYPYNYTEMRALADVLVEILEKKE